MSRRGATLTGLLVLLIGIAVAGGLYGLSAPDRPMRPAFTLPDLQGQSRSISDFDGDVIVLNFWATWCRPCRHEIPMLVQAQKDLAKKGLRIVGVAVDTRGAATQFVDRYQISYPVLAAPTEGARVQDRYTGGDTPAGVLPYTVVIDRKGRIAARVAGALTRARLDQIVKPLL